MEEKNKNSDSWVLSIPVIKLDELTTIDDGELFHAFYGINNIKNEKKAIEVIEKYVYDNDFGDSLLVYDFIDETEINTSKWNIMYGLNTYTNTNSNRKNSLILNNKSNFERVFWYKYKK